MIEGISIVVCCYNSEKRLATTLRALHQLVIPPGVEVELILVDNNSTDDTAGFAGRFWQDAGPNYPIRIITEAQQGIGYARLRGIASAQYPIVLFVDDDNELQPDYLLVGYEVLAQHPNVGVLSGMSHGVFQEPLPRWVTPGFPFKSLMNALAVTTKHTSTHGYLKYDYQNVVTAGAFFRRKIFDTVLGLGHSLILKGRSGKTLLSGEDDEFCYWAKMMGYKLYRSTGLHFHHHIDPSRINQPYFERLFYGFGYGSIILDSYLRCLRGEKSFPDTNAVLRQANRKIRLFQTANEILSPLFRDKMFKLRLLARFQEGVAGYLKENPQLPELRASITRLKAALVAEAPHN